MEVMTSVDFNGVDQKLQALGLSLARSILKNALRPVGAMLVGEAKSRVPVASGDLRESIAQKTTSRLSKRGLSATTTVGPMSGIVTRQAGNGSQQPSVYAMWVELGTVKSRPRPFLRPALDSNAEKCVTMFAEKLFEDLDNIVAEAK